MPSRRQLVPWFYNAKTYRKFKPRRKQFYSELEFNAIRFQQQAVLSLLWQCRLYCGSLLFGISKKTDKLQRVLNATVCIISNTRKYDRSHFLRNMNTLHRLDVVHRMQFRLCVQIYRCLHSTAPKYLSALCRPVSDTCSLLESGQLDFPRLFST